MNSHLETNGAIVTWTDTRQSPHVVEVTYDTINQCAVVRWFSLKEDAIHAIKDQPYFKDKP